MNKKIRIAFILSGLGHVKRGAEFVFLNLMERLAKKEDLEISAYGGGKDFHIEELIIITYLALKEIILSGYLILKDCI